MSVTIIKDLGKAVREQQDHHAARRKTDENEAKQRPENPPTVSRRPTPERPKAED